jgi:hypothetical protein
MKRPWEWRREAPVNQFNPMTRRQGAFARCDATGRTVDRPSLYGHCLACGATVYDWRRLLGIGARIVARTTGACTVLLSHLGACGDCGASEVLVTALGAAVAGEPLWLPTVVGRLDEEVAEGEERLVPVT